MSLTEDEVRALVRLRIKQYATRKSSSGFTAWCQKNGVNKGHASGFMNGKKPPGSDLLDALHLQVSYSFKEDG